MKRICAFMMMILIGLAGVPAQADELVFTGVTGLVTYVKKNVRLLDTVSVSGIPNLRYSSLEGTVQLPVANVIEIRFMPYDLSDVSITQSIPDTTAVPLRTLTTTTAVPKSVTVSSISALKSALADNTVDEIVVNNGKYSISTASSQGANSLWIGSAYASRTRPIVVRAKTRGLVTFDGGGASGFGALTFVGGAHDQVWDGFNFTNGTPTQTGVVVVGGYTSGADVNPVHHITLRYCSWFGLWGNSPTASSPANDHGVYFSYAGGGGVHDILFDYCTFDDRAHAGVTSAFHFYHSDPANGLNNANNVTIRNLTVYGTQQAILMWDGTLKNITVSDAVIKNTLRYAVRCETAGSTGIVLKNIISTGSGEGTGFYSSEGSSPSGITFINNSFK